MLKQKWRPGKSLLYSHSIHLEEGASNSYKLDAVACAISTKNKGLNLLGIDQSLRCVSQRMILFSSNCEVYFVFEWWLVNHGWPVGKSTHDAVTCKKIVIIEKPKLCFPAMDVKCLQLDTSEGYGLRKSMQSSRKVIVSMLDLPFTWSWIIK